MSWRELHHRTSEARSGLCTCGWAGESQDDRGALPNGDDYSGLGKALLQFPKSTLYDNFVRKGLIELNIQFITLDDGGQDCFVHCTIQHTSTAITTYGAGSSKATTEKQALLVSSSRFHANVSLQELSQGREELHSLKLLVDDDVLIVMLGALRDLRIVARFSTTKRGRWRMASSTSANQKRFNEQDKAARSLSLPEGRLRDKGKLPISKRKDETLDLVEKNTYSLIIADTDSGKSTQSTSNIAR
ncbi:hypothetical protein BBP40_001149 [Aspergillus hancockii]|nr:hypothetical protein BBP40_001149 [Aspergillus hancockii]